MFHFFCPCSSCAFPRVRTRIGLPRLILRSTLSGSSSSGIPPFLLLWSLNRTSFEQKVICHLFLQRAFFFVPRISKFLPLCLLMVSVCSPCEDLGILTHAGTARTVRTGRLGFDLLKGQDFSLRHHDPSGSRTIQPHTH
jgi:hypothetical protein